jgi:hypothetical protein
MLCYGSYGQTLWVSIITHPIGDDCLHAMLSLSCNCYQPAIIFCPFPIHFSPVPSHLPSLQQYICQMCCRYLALVAALASEADWVLIPEWPPEKGWEDVLCNKLAQVSGWSHHHWLIVLFSMWPNLFAQNFFVDLSVVVVLDREFSVTLTVVVVESCELCYSLQQNVQE